MKIFLALVISVLASSAFAQVDNIQVNVNGRIYQCSGSTGGHVDTCRSKTDILNSKYEACKNTSQLTRTCFDKTFGNVILKSCIYWSESCNNACSEAQYLSETCFNKCYEN